MGGSAEERPGAHDARNGQAEGLDTDRHQVCSPSGETHGLFPGGHGGNAARVVHVEEQESGVEEATRH
jgi:hypothetical protein